ELRGPEPLTQPAHASGFQEHHVVGPVVGLAVLALLVAAEDADRAVELGADGVVVLALGDAEGADALRGLHADPRRPAPSTTSCQSSRRRSRSSRGASSSGRSGSAATPPAGEANDAARGASGARRARNEAGASGKGRPLAQAIGTSAKKP